MSPEDTATPAASCRFVTGQGAVVGAAAGGISLVTRSVTSPIFAPRTKPSIRYVPTLGKSM